MPGHHPADMAGHYRSFCTIDRRWRRIRQRLARHHVSLTAGWGYAAVLLIVPLIVLVAFLLHRTHTTYSLLSGPKGSSREVVGRVMAEVLNQATPLERFLHLNIVPDYLVQETCGSLDNLYYLNHGLAQLAIVHDGLPLDAVTEPSCPLPIPPARVHEGPLEMRTRAVFPLFTAPLHIVARRDLKIGDLTELRPGMKIYFGSASGASAYVSRNLLEKIGVVITPPEEVLTYEESLARLRDGRLDVGFFLMGLNAQVLQDLMRTGRFMLLSIGQASGLQMHFPYLHTVTIPGGTYEGVPQEVVTLGATTILAASTELTETEVYKIAGKLSQRLHDILRDVPMNLARTVDTDPSKELYYPLHEGAIRFFEHDPPFMFDPRILAGLGTYVSLLYAAYGMSSQYLKKYRVQRVLYAIDRVVRCSGSAASEPKPRRYQAHVRRVLLPALQALRHHNISYEDFQRITEYVKGHA